MENVPTPVTLSVDGPAGALPVFVTVTLVLVSDETTRSGRSGMIDHETTAGAPTCPAASVARTANVCAPAPSDADACGL